MLIKVKKNCTLKSLVSKRNIQNIASVNFAVSFPRHNFIIQLREFDNRLWKIITRKEIRSSRKWKIILLSLLLEDKTSRFDHHLQRPGDVPAQLLKFFSLIMQMQISRRPAKVHDLSYPQLASASRWKISAKDWWKIHGAIFVARLCKQ